MFTSVRRVDGIREINNVLSDNLVKSSEKKLTNDVSFI